MLFTFHLLYIQFLIILCSSLFVYIIQSDYIFIFIIFLCFSASFFPICQIPVNFYFAQEHSGFQKKSD